MLKAILGEMLRSFSALNVLKEQALRSKQQQHLPSQSRSKRAFTFTLATTFVSCLSMGTFPFLLFLRVKCWYWTCWFRQAGHGGGWRDRHRNSPCSRIRIIGELLRITELSLFNKRERETWLDLSKNRKEKRAYLYGLRLVVGLFLIPSGPVCYLKTELLSRNYHSGGIIIRNWRSGLL